MRSTLLLLLLATACKDSPTPIDSVPDPVDGDGDGFYAEDDCDDGDATIHPDAEEACDGVDNNCDGQTDEGVQSTFYADNDGDGYGAGEPITACAAEEGQVALDGDCDDSSAEFNPMAPETDCADPNDYNCDGSVGYADADGDGFAACQECDDGAAAVNPAATELCDELDNNCDGAIDEDTAADASAWYADSDGDGFGDPNASSLACDQPSGSVADSTDCDDALTEVNPAATELCDGLDNNCDGTIDEDSAADASAWYADGDGDGYGDPSSATLACTQPSGSVADDTDCDDAVTEINPAATELCDTLDNNCDGVIDEDTAADASTWYADGDADGYGDPNASALACDQPSGSVADDTDCDDGIYEINPAATELCDGQDNNCDGSIDEDTAADASTWYADADSDSYGDPNSASVACSQPSGSVSDDTDCDDSDAAVYPGASELWYDGVDSDCDGDESPDPCLGLPGASTVSYDPDATASRPTSSWSVVTEWTSASLGYDVGTSYNQVMAAPVVGQLTDDDGDGDIDAEDMPDVLFTTFTGGSYSSAGYLRVFSGDGTGIHWSLSSAGGYSITGAAGVAVGDIEGDGSPDILVMSTTGRILALEYDGNFKWASSGTSYAYAGPSLHDMDGDGCVEVIAGELIVDCNGVALTTLGSHGGYYSFAADVDGDGQQEAITGDATWSMAGVREWTSTITTGSSALVNLDADDGPEVVSFRAGLLSAMDDTGGVLWQVTIDSTGYTPPCVADYDGDGGAEIGVASASRFYLVDDDGAVLWSASTSDASSGTMTCSGFDFDGDGATEVIYGDRTNLFIWDGATGTALYTNGSMASGSIYEYPLVADVDNDGEAELVVPANNYSISGWTGIVVLGEQNGLWASARNVWNQHAYYSDNINDDMSVPAAPAASWLDHNSFRGQQSWSDNPAGAANLRPEIIGACEDCSASSVELYAVVDNLGSVFAPASDVALYAVNGGATTLLEVQSTGVVLNPGDRLAPMTFVVDLADIGADGLLLVVDDDGAGVGARLESDESDNAASWDELSCP